MHRFYKKIYLDFFVEAFAEDLLLEVFFALEAETFFVEDLLHLQLEICSTAKDQKYSSWPCGQPAFCQL